MTKKLWEILVPGGYGFNHHAIWDSKVMDIAGGLTVLRPLKGRWVSPDGEVFKEPMIPVRIMCTDKQIVKIADMTMEHYGQQSVMVYKLSDEVFQYWRKKDG